MPRAVGGEGGRRGWAVVDLTGDTGGHRMVQTDGGRRQGRLVKAGHSGRCCFRSECLFLITNNEMRGPFENRLVDLIKDELTDHCCFCVV